MSDRDTKKNLDHPTVSFRCANRAEHTSIADAALRNGLTVSEWVRAACMEILLTRGGAL